MIASVSTFPRAGRIASVSFFGTAHNGLEDFVAALEKGPVDGSWLAGPLETRGAGIVRHLRSAAPGTVTALDIREAALLPGPAFVFGPGIAPVRYRLSGAAKERGEATSARSQAGRLVLDTNGQQPAARPAALMSTPRPSRARSEQVDLFGAAAE
ncbi:hypothetical protein DYI37_04080 [Fulvimarina endophytica]|uniref:Uncharacterized protein n=1 Tax=Fulvimarina endophytica TaxID=2293836 RepID=A0A371X730_9HYPH|nr:hypothetical protein [Fulvimarina endophytica]RFC65052.1 hypothetical protein DYI37_04080 [Fulvimarina endophytica]